MVVPGVNVHSAVAASAQERLLTTDALTFLAELHRKFEPTRQRLLAARVERQKELDAGAKLSFLPETASVRADKNWTCAPPAPGLEDRRVEITGPTDRKMVVNALNSGANAFMTDFEDANCPTFSNMLEGQINLYDAIRRQVDFEAGGKKYKLAEKPAVLLVRPRGWHLDEPRLTIDGTPISGGLFDFGLFFFHNAHEQVRRGLGPYFYLPKMEHHLEARLWNDVFIFAQDHIAMPQGTIRATVLIETLPAAFQMEEILYELKEHSAGLNCGRWDYIFSFIKKRRADPAAVLPDRSKVTMTVPFMDAYVRLLIQTCHKRGVAAMGGMSAQIPIKGNDAANDAAMAKVKADKEREARAGHDGAWVAHPALVPLARAAFDAHMPGPNALGVLREDVHVSAEDLIDTQGMEGKTTMEGVRANVSAALAYAAAWLGGKGCVALNGLMEDAATAEIARTQLWQWIRYRALVEGADVLTSSAVVSVVGEEAEKLSAGGAYDAGNVAIAAEWLKGQLEKEWPSEFMTSDLMHHLVKADGVKQS